jgi:hypothetical protein
MSFPHYPEVLHDHLLHAIWRRSCLDLAVQRVLTCHVDFCSQGSSVSHTVKPTRHGFLFGNGASLSNQDEKCRLKSVLNILDIRKHPPADGEHQWAMPLHQSAEGILIPLGNEPFQELTV